MLFRKWSRMTWKLIMNGDNIRKSYTSYVWLIKKYLKTWLNIAVFEYKVLGFQDALRPSPISTFIMLYLWTFSLFIHYKTTTKRFADLMIFLCGFSKNLKNRKFLEANFWNSDHPLTLPGVISHEKIWPDWFCCFYVHRLQTSRQAKYVYR